MTGHFLKSLEMIGNIKRNTIIQLIWHFFNILYKCLLKIVIWFYIDSLHVLLIYHYLYRIIYMVIYDDLIRYHNLVPSYRQKYVIYFVCSQMHFTNWHGISWNDHYQTYKMLSSFFFSLCAYNKTNHTFFLKLLCKSTFYTFYTSINIRHLTSFLLFLSLLYWTR